MATIHKDGDCGFLKMPRGYKKKKNNKNADLRVDFHWGQSRFKLIKIKLIKWRCEKVNTAIIYAVSSGQTCMYLERPSAVFTGDHESNDWGFS